jgi:hypothetical protein
MEYGSLGCFVHLQDVLAESVLGDGNIGQYELFACGIRKDPFYLFTPILQTFLTLIFALSPMDTEKEK